MSDINEEQQPIKKRRGRPKKDEPAVHNEQNKMVTMSKKDDNYISSSDRHFITNNKVEVGVVQDSNFNMADNITVEQLSRRWSSIFSKYSQSLGFDAVMGSYSQNFSMLNNPFIQNSRTKRINTSPLSMSKEELEQALADPESNEYGLRGMSWFLYYTNYVYYNMIQIQRNVPKYCWYSNPCYIESLDKKKLQKDSIFIDKAMKKLNPSVTFKDIATQVNVEGKSSYLIRASYDQDDVNYLLLQKLDSNQVKITGFGSQQKFVVSFNLVIFLEAGYDVSQYPKFIQDEWESLFEDGTISRDKRGKLKFNPKANIPDGHSLESFADGHYAYWVQLPQDLAWTFFEDGGNSNVIPSTISMFPDFQSLADYRWLQGSLLSKGVNSILTAEVPLVKDPKPGADSTAVSVDTILGYTDLFNSSVSNNVLPFFAPFTEFELHSVESQPEALDVVYDRVRDLIATTGNSALVSIADKPSISSVQTARMLQEAKSDFLTKQFESFCNFIFKNAFKLNYDWRITIHGGIFNFREDAKECKELVLTGKMRGLLPRLLSYYDMSLEDFKGSECYIDALDIKFADELIQSDSEQGSSSASKGKGTSSKSLTTTSSSSSSSSTSSKSVGRPSLSDDSVQNDNTGTSKDAGTNSSEIKKN